MPTAVAPAARIAAGGEAESTALAPNLVGVIIWFQGPPGGFNLFDGGDGHFDDQGFCWIHARAAGQFKGMGGGCRQRRLGIAG